MIGVRVTLAREVRGDLPGEVTLSRNLKEEELARGRGGETTLWKGGSSVSGSGYTLLKYYLLQLHDPHKEPILPMEQ